MDWTCRRISGRLPRSSGVLLDELAIHIDDGLNIGPFALLLQAAVVLEHRQASQALAARLACVAHLAADGNGPTCVPRHLGDAATLAGDRRAARAYYAQALVSAAKIRFRPELALTHLSLAELLARGNTERSQALEHLQLALPELREMKMQPALERAVALSHNLDAASGHPAHRTTDGLTSREREIAVLISDGCSNHEIAERLVIAEGTVEVHIKHILSKLGFRSRTQVATWLANQRSDKATGNSV